MTHIFSFNTVQKNISHGTDYREQKNMPLTIYCWPIWHDLSAFEHQHHLTAADAPASDCIRTFFSLCGPADILAAMSTSNSLGIIYSVLCI